MSKIEMIVERTDTGYSAYSEKYPVFTTGGNLEELKSNMVGALNFYFSEKGKSITEGDLRIRLDIPQFFSFYRVINAKALSGRIGMNPSLLAQNVIGIKKPSAAQGNRILQGLHQLGKELQEISLLL